MLFSHLQNLIATGQTLQLTITPAPDQCLNVSVVYTSPDGTSPVNPALVRPLVITSTPEELDQQLAEAITTFSVARLSIGQQTQNAVLALEQQAGNQDADDSDDDTATRSSSPKSVRKPNPAQTARPKQPNNPPQTDLLDFFQQGETP